MPGASGDQGTSHRRWRSRQRAQRLAEAGERRVLAAAGGPSRSWPDALIPLARAIAPTRRPRLVTGVAARAALGAAAARAATVGDRVLLPHPPRRDPGDLEVVAHELSHVAERAARPRFLLRAASGVLDAGERRARKLGSTIAASGDRAVRTTTDRATGVRERLVSAPTPALGFARERLTGTGAEAARWAGAPASLVDVVDSAAGQATATAERIAEQARRPVAQALGAGHELADQARERAHAITAEGRRHLDQIGTRVTDTVAQHHRRGAAVVGGLEGTGRSMMDDARRSATQATTSARGRADAVLDAGRRWGDRTLAAGQQAGQHHVDRVGAELDRSADLLAGGVDRVRTRAASLPVGPRGVVAGAAGDLHDQARAATVGVRQPATAATERFGGVANQHVMAAQTAAGTAATRLAGQVTAAGAAAGGAANRLVSDAATTIGAPAASPVPTSTAGRTDEPTDAAVDALLEHLEERLLEQLERRGGRYGGMF